MSRYEFRPERPFPQELALLVSANGGTPTRVIDFGDEMHCSSRERAPDTWGHPSVFVRWRADRQQIEVES